MTTVDAFSYACRARTTPSPLASTALLHEYSHAIHCVFCLFLFFVTRTPARRVPSPPIQLAVWAMTTFKLAAKIRVFLQRQQQGGRRRGSTDFLSPPPSEDELSDDGSTQSSHDAIQAGGSHYALPVEGEAGTSTIGARGISNATNATTMMGERTPSSSTIASHVGEMLDEPFEAEGWPLEDD